MPRAVCLATNQETLGVVGRITFRRCISKFINSTADDTHLLRLRQLLASETHFPLSWRWLNVEMSTQIPCSQGSFVIPVRSKIVQQPQTTPRVARTILSSQVTETTMDVKATVSRATMLTWKIGLELPAWANCP